MSVSPNHPKAVAVDLEEGERLLAAFRKAEQDDYQVGETEDNLLVWVFDNLPALLASVREARELREAVAKVLSRGRSGDGWLEVPPKEVEALAALQEPK